MVEILMTSYRHGQLIRDVFFLAAFFYRLALVKFYTRMYWPIVAAYGLCHLS